MPLRLLVETFRAQAVLAAAPPLWRLHAAASCRQVAATIRHFHAGAPFRFDSSWHWPTDRKIRFCGERAIYLIYRRRYAHSRDDAI